MRWKIYSNFLGYWDTCEALIGVISRGISAIMSKVLGFGAPQPSHNLANAQSWSLTNLQLFMKNQQNATSFAPKVLDFDIFELRIFNI